MNAITVNQELKFKKTKKSQTQNPLYYYYFDFYKRSCFSSKALE